MLGIALEGGGVRCAAQVGVLLALEEERLYPDMIAGCGAGAWVAALYAMGIRGEELRDAVLQVARRGEKLLVPGRLQALRLALSSRMPTGGLYQSQKLHRLLRFQTLDAILRDAPLPLAIPTLDIESGSVQVLSSVLPTQDAPCAWNRHAAMADAVLAALAMPGLLAPVSWRGRRLTGGNGLAPCLPKLLRAMGAVRILRVSVLSHGLSPYTHDLLSIMLAGTPAGAQDGVKAQVLHIPLPTQASVSDFSWIPQHVEQGYLAAKQALPGLIALLRAQGRVLPFSAR